jgi:hypothetical protein
MRKYLIHHSSSENAAKILLIQHSICNPYWNPVRLAYSRAYYDVDVRWHRCADVQGRKVEKEVGTATVPQRHLVGNYMGRIYSFVKDDEWT